MIYFTIKPVELSGAYFKLNLYRMGLQNSFQEHYPGLEYSDHPDY